MRINRFIRRFLFIVPLVLFTALLLGLFFVRVAYGMILPWWASLVLGIYWLIMAFDYLQHAEIFKQIGGFLVVAIAVVILTGALVPREHVASYPRLASDQMVGKMDSAWNAVYTGNVFQTYSPKQKLIDYISRLGTLDPFRHGKMILFGLLGFFMAVVYLFPMKPPHPLAKLLGRGCKHPDPAESGKRGLEGRAESSSALYRRRFALLFLAGGTFALQMELLQVLTITRVVTFYSIVDSCLGILVGLLIFLPIHFFYSLMGERRKRGSQRFNVLGVGVDALDMDGCLERFEEIIEDESWNEESGRREDRAAASQIRPSVVDSDRQPAMTSALGVAGIMAARRDPKLQRILNDSVLNTPDGMPLVWLGKLYGYRYINRVYGPDLLRDVCAYSVKKGWRHFFYGAAPGIADKLKERLEEKHPNIEVVGTYCPPFRALTKAEEADLVERVAKTKPDIFWIGISTPRQLYFMDAMRAKLDCKIICPVGYGFDVNAGIRDEAPEWVKLAGFQWIHRAIKQPRLWKRYLPDNPLFVWDMVLQILHIRSFPPYLHEVPTSSQGDKFGIIRYPVDSVSISAVTYERVLATIEEWIAREEHQYINVCTSDTVVKCHSRPDLAKVVTESGVSTPDGMPLVWLGHLRGLDLSRVYGPDLMLETLRYGVSRGWRHYFYGATDSVLERLQSNLKERFPNLKIAGAYSPPFRPLEDNEKEEVAARINKAKPQIVWCGLGTPKQDYWVAEFSPRLNANAVIAVGAAFNFHAGQVHQAPRWMMRCGLEWLFRLLIEPRRLWRRYIIGNPRFLLMITGALLREMKMRMMGRGKRTQDIGVKSETD